MAEKKAAKKAEKFDPKTLTYSKKSGWDGISEAKMKEIMNFAEGYKKFLTDAKTEREAVSTIFELALLVYPVDLSKLQNGIWWRGCR